MIQIPTIFEERVADETLKHRYRVAFLADAFARFLGFEEPVSNLLFEGGFFHDMGKEKIDPHLLYKTNPLTPQEVASIKEHVIKAVESDLFDTFCIEVKWMILQHHEKIDGSGYPLGLKGDEIHPFAQMISLCDIFDAMTSPRSYHQSESKESVLAWIESQKGRQFHPELADDFISFAHQMPASLFKEAIAASTK